MVDSALNHLNQNPWTQDTTDLIRNLFTKDGKDPRKTDMSKVKAVLHQIGRMYRTEVTQENVGDLDVIIFCDDSRFELIDEGKKLYKDKTINQLLYYNEQQCKGRRRDMDDKVALAVTVNPVLTAEVFEQTESQWVYTETEKPTQIQICPWFVDWIKNHDYKLHNDVARSNIGRTVVKVTESTNHILRQIDAFNLLDKVLLHEMTHGRSAWQTSVGGQNIVGLADVSSQTRVSCIS
ncbi:uncharacterized protein BDR25DRAFT_289905 [Lindgomyces ingoldianus]|uniref:Uncharacterized protein n=1 Tax=Lindgomyces ingoldianus TaxID=673940 RepID=A0ACB6QPT9_9PLEO|nr:uncharacterized protein BDR25DRAFT_289905 [Lindgomyces ingoldianus]KAF2468916.1 hypothetical protein BDR25DRAFT_289905 [Lindgomyces ingoldianus]